MWRRKICCAVIACVMVLSLCTVSTHATQITSDQVATFATNSFSFSLPTKSQSVANSSFSLAAGETVTIKATYSPYYASVDFGLVDEDGVYHFFNVTTGSTDKTIQITESGKYTLQIRNNSSVTVSVSGVVNY